MLESLANWTMSVISMLGYPGVFLLMTLESALIPIPSEVTMPFSGFLATQGQFNFWLVVAVGTLGNLAGSLLAYALGFWGQEAIVRRVIRSWGKYLLISGDELDRAEGWFRKYGETIVFFSRILPAVRTFISLPAGIARMNLTKFTIYTVLGSVIWSTFLAYMGVVMGQNWTAIRAVFHKFDIVMVGLGITIVVWYIAHKIKKIRKIGIAE